jgi:hypothetical protein
LLKTQDPLVSVPEAGPTSFTSTQSSGVGLQPVGATDFGSQNPPGGVVNEVPTERWRYTEGSPQQPIDDLGFNPDINMSMGLDDTPFTWEMIGLGLEEPLPPRETIDELYVVGLIHSPDNTLTCKQTSNILRKNTSISADDTQVSLSRSNESVSYWSFLEYINLWILHRSSGCFYQGSRPWRFILLVYRGLTSSVCMPGLGSTGSSAA